MFFSSHAAEIKKQKDVMQTAEKLRREKWIKDKSQQIKVSRNNNYIIFCPVKDYCMILMLFCFILFRN